ncbi:MAG: signal recognition particle receptor subunit alpha, partial [Candidatus Aenigmatarchaeota archaeon]
MFGFLKKKVREVVERVSKSSEKEAPKESKKTLKPENLSTAEKPVSLGKEKKAPGEVAPEMEKPSEKPPEMAAKSITETPDKAAEKKKTGFSLFSRKVSEKDLEELKMGLVRSNMTLEAAEKIVEGLKDTEAKNFQ